ncbi:MAG: hypothetical protein IKP88_07530 [Lachnospiraceae bacterium]|nr:hypothetical protein [Lachnospiraceae bacterium]
MQSSGGIIEKTLNKISDRLLNLSKKTEGIQGKTPEFLVVLLYCVFHMLMMLVHEPWFDEALAWLISRDSSLYDIIFSVPHYEGHPSLWHLVLMPFAKLGAPYEFSLSFVSLIFSGTAMVILVYKAPFKRIIRLLIPFTFYLFYQYSVISRPYCMMMLAIILMGLTYPKKDEHPGRFVLSMLFLCMTGAYGLVISCGICIVWLVEMWRGNTYKISGDSQECNSGIKGMVKNLLSHGKIVWLLLLLCYAIFILLRIIPKKDAYAELNRTGTVVFGLVGRVVYTLFGGISDIFITNTFSQDGTLANAGITIPELFSCVAIGAVILLVIFMISRKKRLTLLFFLPYSMLCISMAVLYASRHHIGIILLYLIFWAWVYCKKENKENEEKQEFSPSTRSLGVLALTLGLIIPLYWGISSSIFDAFYSYSWGREESAYLIENNLQNKSILAEWSLMPTLPEEKETVDDSQASVLKEAITFSGPVVYLSPYIPDAQFINSPDKMGYSFGFIHKVPQENETSELITSIRSSEKPDVIIGEVNYSAIYSFGEFDMNDYVCVHTLQGGAIWKGVPQIHDSKIYVSKKVLSQN